MVTAAIKINGVTGSNDNLSLGVSVSLSNSNNTGVSSWSWQFVSKPPGSSAIILTPASSTASFVPDVVGSYLIRLTVIGGSGSDTNEVIGAVQQREFSAEELEASVFSGIIDDPDSVLIVKEGHLHTVPRRLVVNRGRNTGGGAAYVYWTSPNSLDTSGIYYSGSVPFGQLTDIIKVGETYPNN